MGELTVLLIGVVDALFAFFVVAPMLLILPACSASRSSSPRHGEEGVIDEATVKQLHPKSRSPVC